jgi:hypothetical protein
MASLMTFVASYQERLRADNFKLLASAERRVNGRGGRGDGLERRRD